MSLELVPKSPQSLLLVLSARALVGAAALGEPSSWLTSLAFKRELDRVRAEDALVADKRELGDFREGRVVMVEQERVGNKGVFFLRMREVAW